MVTDGHSSRHFQKPLTERNLQRCGGAGAAVAGLAVGPSLLLAQSHDEAQKQQLLEVAEMKPMLSPKYNKNMCWGETAAVMVQISLKR